MAIQLNQLGVLFYNTLYEIIPIFNYNIALIFIAEKCFRVFKVFGHRTPNLKISFLDGRISKNGVGIFKLKPP